MATFTSPPQDQSLTRVDFDDNAFRRTIAQKGLTLTWHQAAECPCRPKATDLGMDLTGVVDIADSSTGHNVICPVCKGTGFLYHSPQDVQAIITSAEDDYLNARFGGYKEGLVNITLNAEHLPCFGDRFVLGSSVMLYRETVDITAEEVYALRFPIATRTLTLAGGVQQFQVIYSHATDAATGLALVGGELTQEVDFTVKAGQIEFVPGMKPAVGARVSFTYFINPSYVVVSYPNSIRDTQVLFKKPAAEVVSLPVRVQAKLEFLEVND